MGSTKNSLPRWLGILTSKNTKNNSNVWNYMMVFHTENIVVVMNKTTYIIM